MIMKKFAILTVLVASTFLLMLQGCGGPNVEGAAFSTSEQLHGRWLSSHAKDGSTELDTEYEFIFFDNNVFIATEYAEGSMRSLSGTYAYDATVQELEMEDYLKGDLAYPDGQMHLFISGAVNREIWLNFEGKAEKFDALEGRWLCTYILINQQRDDSTEYDLQFFAENTFKLFKRSTTSDKINGKYEYDIAANTIVFRDEADNVKIEGTIFKLGSQMRIQTKDGKEYLFEKQE